MAQAIRLDKPRLFLRRSSPPSTDGGTTERNIYRDGGIVVEMGYQLAYRYRLYPNPEQRAELAKTFGCARWVYNWALRLRTDAYYGEGRSMGYAETAQLLTQKKKEAETAWLAECSAVVLQQSLRNLERAFTNFFEGRSGYPSFKRKRDRQSARYVGTAFDVRDGRLKLAKIPGTIKVRWSRTLPSKPSSCTVTLDTAGRYHVSFVVEVDAKPLPKLNRSIGVDLGLNDLVVTSSSDGEVWHSGNPRHLRKSLRRLKRAQRSLSRKQKGSRNWEKARRKVARIHAKIADQRRDFLHKLTRKLVDENQVLCFESLAVKNMVRNRNIALSISDAGWGELLRLVQYKAEMAGRTVVLIDRFFPSSKRCSACGHVIDNLPLNVRCWTCPECKAEHQRDANAAENIRRVGHTRSQACGDHGKSSSAFMLAGSDR